MFKDKILELTRSFILPFVGIILAWILVVPPFEFPDEQAHLGTISYLSTEKRLPGYHEPDMTIEMAQVQKLLGVFRNSEGQNRYTYHPEYRPEYTNTFIGKHEPEIIALNTRENRTTYTNIEEAARYPALYYLYGSFFWKLSNGSLLTRLFVVRLGSLALYGLMAYATYKIGLLLFSNRKMALTLASITLFQPMMSFVSAGISSDNLHNLLFMYAIYQGLLVIKEGISIRRILLLVLTLSADLYTKPQGFIMIPVVVTALVFRVIKERRYKLLGSIFVLIALTFFLTWGQVEKYKGFLNVENSYGASLTEYLRFSVNKLVAQNVVWYWGVFKWLGVVLSPIYWRTANRVVLLSLLGLFVYLYKRVKNKAVVTPPLYVIYLLCASAIYAGVIFWFDWQYVKGWGFSLGVQARYFFPTIVAHMALLMIGLMSLGPNKTSRLWIQRFIFLLFLWLQLGGIWRVIGIYYDTSSVGVLLTQISQYKPMLAKGLWWSLWGLIYLLSLSRISHLVLTNRSLKKK